MSSKFWMKMYHEILWDVKMRSLSYEEFTTCMRVFLLAGHHHDDGYLPDQDEIEFMLNMDAETVARNFSTLEKKGILTKTDGRWLVTNWDERQRKDTPAERVEKHRAGMTTPQKAKKTTDETVQLKVTEPGNIKLPIDKIREDIDIDKDKKREEPEQVQNPAAAGVANALQNVKGLNDAIGKAYSNNIGSLTPMIADSLAEMEKKYSADWLMMAMEEAVRANARNINYIHAILRRWAAEGFKSKKEPNQKNVGTIVMGAKFGGTTRQSSEDLRKELDKILAEAGDGND